MSEQGDYRTPEPMPVQPKKPLRCWLRLHRWETVWVSPAGRILNDKCLLCGAERERIALTGFEG